jgi:pyrimidine operon attenuation protein/uracil phosphoribosyltransferase
MNQILNKQDIARKLTRIAYQILENNYEENELFLLGIVETGLVVAERIKVEILKINPEIQVNIIAVKINKTAPIGNVTYSIPIEILSNKVAILTDDVGNSGRTLFYALQPLMTILPKKIQVAVLVERTHKLFPVSADFVGLSLATTIHEHISVQLNEGEEAAYLS